MVKSNRNGQAATLTTEQLDALANELSPSPRAVFSLCRYTAARVNEALSLKWENLTQAEVVIPKKVTKKKMAKKQKNKVPFRKETERSIREQGSKS